MENISEMIENIFETSINKYGPPLEEGYHTYVEIFYRLVGYEVSMCRIVLDMTLGNSTFRSLKLPFRCLPCGVTKTHPVRDILVQ